MKAFIATDAELSKGRSRGGKKSANRRRKVGKPTTDQLREYELAKQAATELHAAWYEWLALPDMMPSERMLEAMADVLAAFDLPPFEEPRNHDQYEMLEVDDHVYERNGDGD